MNVSQSVMCHNLVRFIRVIYAIAIETSGSVLPESRSREFASQLRVYVLASKGSARYDEEGCHCSCISMISDPAITALQGIVFKWYQTWHCFLALRGEGCSIIVKA